MEQKYHIPVMVQEILQYVNPKPGDVIVDGTLGTAGHARQMIERILPGGKFIGLDRDRESLEIGKQRLRNFAQACVFAHANFSDLDRVLAENRIRQVDGMIFDLGVSSFQLDDPERGFSFQADGPLDMRLDRSSYISAYDLLNTLTEQELSVLLRNFGQERWHNRIARYLIRERERAPISSTAQLAQLVVRAIPTRYRRRHYRIHPATRTFQAVRIAVNRELETLEASLEKACLFLRPGARICVISFHSLEDRIVKLLFRRKKAEAEMAIVTPKPVTPLQSEIEANPRSRSSKLRVAEKL